MMQHLCRELFVCDVVREGYYMRALSTYSVISRCCPCIQVFPLFQNWQIWHFLTWVSNLTAYFCCISRCSLKLLKRRRSLSSRNTFDLFLQTLFFGYNHHIHVGLNTKNFFSSAYICCLPSTLFVGWKERQPQQSVCVSHLNADQTKVVSSFPSVNNPKSVCKN